MNTTLPAIFLRYTTFSFRAVKWYRDGYFLRKSNFRMPKPGFYAVRNGRIPGIYTTWAECEAQVKGHPNASYKKFASKHLAEEYVGNCISKDNPLKSMPKSNATTSLIASKTIAKPLTSTSYSNSYLNPSTSLGSYSTRSNPVVSNSPSSPVILSEQDLIDSIRLVELLFPDSAKSKGPFYAVHRGTRPGVYKTWTECEAQIKNTNNASYRKFDNEEEAQEYVRTGGIVKATKREIRDVKYNNYVVKKLKNNDSEPEFVLRNRDETVVIFTDGASAENGKQRARAGIGVYWGPDHPLNTSKRITGRQTNNRAEIQAAIHALRQAKEIGAQKVKLYTDSQFLIHSITDWIKKWKSNGWKLVNGESVVNKEDFIELESAGIGLEVEYVYVKAHARNHGNDEADRLAVAGARLLLEPANCSKFLNSNKTEMVSINETEPFFVINADSSGSEILPLIIPEENIQKKSFYAVYRGKCPGVYLTWVECEEQIKDWPKPVFRKFTTEAEASEFVRIGKIPKKILQIPDHGPDNYVTVFTDGASSSNGKAEAKAGIGVYWGPGNELNTSMRLPGRQTNNRAEIHAAVYALKQAKQLGIRNLRLYTDSQYVIKGITSWIITWKKNGWMSASGKLVENREDFMALDSACQDLNIDWCYVKGHDNNPGNVEADKLAVAGCIKQLFRTMVLA